MKLVKPKFEIIPQSEGLEGIYQQIELAGRTCYKSNPQYEYFDLTDRPNEPIERYVNCEINISKEEAFDRGLVIRRSTTAKDFVERMIKSEHCYTKDSEVLTENGWIKWELYNGER